MFYIFAQHDFPGKNRCENQGIKPFTCPVFTAFVLLGL